MCGLVAFLTSGFSLAERQAVIKQMLASISHRGPDGEGVHLVPGQALFGHRRLAVIDLEHGAQPMLTSDQRYSLVFNGEIYNYLELRNELEQEGCHFLTQSDTEVLLQLLVHRGESAIESLNGMFAFVFHDRASNTWIAARDHFGIKPLYFTKPENGFCGFASELPTLLNIPGVSRKVHPQRLYDYLVKGDYDFSADTMIDDIHHLQPGHILEIDCQSGKALKDYCYWQPLLNPLRNISFNDAAEQLREMFLENIRLHLRSDVSLGAALSGGVDSSAVTAAIRYLEPDFELKTFTFVAANSPVDEEQWANQVIEHTGARAHKVRIAATEMLDDIDDLIRTQGEPFGGTSIYAQYRVFKLAAGVGTKVMLEGQGADELFAGYIGFPAERIKSLLAAGNITKAWQFFNCTIQWPDRNRLMVFKRLVNIYAPKGLRSALWSLGRSNLTPEWLQRNWLNDNKVQALPPEYYIQETDNRFVHQALIRLSTQTGLPRLLRHGDRNSMKFSIESRVPFLTAALADFSLTLPEEYLVSPLGETKSVFKAAMRDIVPKRILDRKDKIGFATPEKQWLDTLSPWVQETLADTAEIPLFNHNKLMKQWRNSNKHYGNQNNMVWRWLNLTRWARIFDIDFS